MKKLTKPKKIVDDGSFDRIEKNLDKILDLIAKERYFPDRKCAIQWLGDVWPSYWHLYEIIRRYVRAYSDSTSLINLVLGK